jgi:hypothetical protein
MTARERLDAHPAPIHPSLRRAPVRNAKVRSNSDTSPHDAPQKMQNKPAFHFGAGVRAVATVTFRAGSYLTSRPAPFEIPQTDHHVRRNHQRLISNGPIETARAPTEPRAISLCPRAVPIEIYRFPGQIRCRDSIRAGPSLHLSSRITL